MEFSRQEYWSGLSFSSPGDLPDPGIESVSLVSLALAGRFFTTVPPEKPLPSTSSVVSNSLQPHGLQHARRPCPWPTPRAYMSIESVMPSTGDHHRDVLMLVAFFFFIFLPPLKYLIFIELCCTCIFCALLLSLNIL